MERAADQPLLGRIYHPQVEQQEAMEAQMSNADEGREQLVAELERLRKRVTALEQVEAERQQSRQALLQSMQQEALLEGVMLVVRGFAGRFVDNLVVARNTIEIIQEDVAMPADLEHQARNAHYCLNAALDDIAKLQQVVRVEIKGTPYGPVLDLDRSTQ